ncbi:ADP-glyceromanno-heptose 6-epimerase [Sneathiella chinensis]|uniref:ADP-L-glycero-D-manno-heptose-6-epimerase n=1 Tax=Sneathiella chinensis TaxID=349750 RepID=A0ABQ5TYC3_9PROT|nr:ADP-glyceromanno-heptose 6-epimerase [Sneathiella chinensis]GLQ04922.1 ADP-L-glycero-D-manno-heptose-6-epimerase [Sneathiella chinensis]
MTKYILVTGGAGFIGSNIVAALSDKGYTVAVCDWLEQGDKWKNLAKHVVTDFIDPDSLMDWLAVQGADLDAIIHMGAISATTETDGDMILNRNFRPTRALWDWCTATRTPFLYASSAATYGDGSAGFDDDQSEDRLATLHPLNLYGWSKHAFDKVVARIEKQGGPTPPQWAGLKFFNVYGPNEYHKEGMKSVIAQSYPKVAGGEPVTLFRSHHPDYEDGGQLRDFVYVKDCVKVILWLLDNPHVSGLFNLGTGKARSFRDLALATFKAAGVEPNITYIDTPEAIRDKYQYFTEANMTKLRQAGYGGNFYSLEDGIEDYVKDYLGKDDPYL